MVHVHTGSHAVLEGATSYSLALLVPATYLRLRARCSDPMTRRGNNSSGFLFSNLSSLHVSEQAMEEGKLPVITPATRGHHGGHTGFDTPPFLLFARRGDFLPLPLLYECFRLESFALVSSLSFFYSHVLLISILSTKTNPGSFLHGCPSIGCS